MSIFAQALVGGGLEICVQLKTCPVSAVPRRSRQDRALSEAEHLAPTLAGILLILKNG